MFSDAGPDIRWVGNEEGIAGDPCWHAMDSAMFVPGDADTKVLNSGERAGARWLPAECDVSIRPGWFYHAAEDEKVRSPENLLDLYFKSVGRGGNFLLNLPPDTRGQIHEQDVRSLLGFRDRLTEVFGDDLAKRGRGAAGARRGDSARFGPGNLIDGNRATCWSTDDGVTKAEAVLEFQTPVSFNIVGLREFLPLGQRVDEFAIDIDRNGQWHEYARGTAIGNRRLVQGATCTTSRVRLRILSGPVCPAISELSLFLDRRQPS
jgi:alpha-L-fucosidase